MKNRERFSQEIIDMLLRGYNFAIDKDSGCFKYCSQIECYKCIFYNDGKPCSIKRDKWLDSEYEDESKLAEEQFKEYCNAHNCSGCKYKNKIDCTVAYIFDNYNVNGRKENNHEV